MTRKLRPSSARAKRRPRGIEVFAYGMGSVLDVFGLTAPRSHLGTLDGDVESVGQDFTTVGKMFQSALDEELSKVMPSVAGERRSLSRR